MIVYAKSNSLEKMEAVNCHRSREAKIGKNNPNRKYIK
jgi:hypothetical protein